MKKLINLVFLTLVLVGFASAQSFEIKTTKDLIVIGEQFDMIMSVTADQGSEVQFPLFNDTVVEHVEVVKIGGIDTANNDQNQSTFTQKVTLTSFDSGYYAISPRYALVNGDSVASNPFLVAVQTIDIDTNSQYYDIKNVASADISFVEIIKEYWPWAAGIIALLAIITYLVYRMSKKREEVVVEKPKPTIPAHIIALKRLEELKTQQLWQEGKVKEYYSELTEILRWFIEQRFNVPALEQTTDEIMQGLKHLPGLESESKESVQRLLYLADLVKFAKQKPVGSENDLHFEMVKSFVENHKKELTENKEDHAA